MATLTAPIQLTEAELKLLQTLVYQECGMFFDERRSHFLKDRLQRRLKVCQLDSFYSYYRLLTSREGKAELALLLENLTVNETSFFRNRPQLDLLQKSVLEEILRKKQERRDWTLRVWSAGCSSGQKRIPSPSSSATLWRTTICGIRCRSTCPRRSRSFLRRGNSRFSHQTSATAVCVPARKAFTPNSRWSR